MRMQMNFVPKAELDAEVIREECLYAGVLTAALVGPPGAGKTTLLEATLRRLSGLITAATAVVHPAADRDTARLASVCERTAAVRSTGPDAHGLRDSLAGISPWSIGLLFIETVGGLAGAPAMGQDLTVAVLSVGGGDDKAAEYERLLADADALVLTQSDLRPHVAFRNDLFLADLRRINPKIKFFVVSAAEGTGLDDWIAWLVASVAEKEERSKAAGQPW